MSASNLHKWATLPDPTPAGEPWQAYFDAHYAELARAPVLYGYYQVKLVQALLENPPPATFPEYLTALVPRLESYPRRRERTDNLKASILEKARRLRAGRDAKQK